MKAINIFASEGSVNNDVSEQISPNSPTSKNCASKAVSHSIINNTVFWKSITNKNSQKKQKEKENCCIKLRVLTINNPKLKQLSNSFRNYEN